MSLTDFVLMVEEKRAALSAKGPAVCHTDAVQWGQYTNDPGNARTSPGPAKEIEVPRMDQVSTWVNPCPALDGA